MPSLTEAYKLMHQGSLALAEVERAGIRIDVPYLEKTIEDVSSKIKELHEGLRQDDVFKQWKRRFGEKTKLTAHAQLGEVVFGDLGFSPNPSLIANRGCEQGKTNTGKWRTDEGSFDHINLPFVKNWVRWQKWVKTRDTFLKGIYREVVDGYLHPFFHLNSTETYRSSSSSPNFQNLPMRDPELAEVIRRCFIPRKDRRLVEVDFGALEFSIAACFWKDKAMVNYASDPNKDIHRDMAAKIWMCSKEQVNKDTRYFSKNQFVFPELYGSYYVKQAQALWQSTDEHNLKVGDVPMKEWLAEKGIDRLGNCDPREEPEDGTFEKHMKKVEENFNQIMFPEFGQKKEKWWKDYRKTGEFRLMTGFMVCNRPHSKNDLLNYPIQGPGFHVMLKSLVLSLEQIRKRKMKTLIVGEIHDCSLADVPDEEIQTYLNMTKYIMTKEVPKQWPWVIVPLKVEVDCTEVYENGGNWWEKKPWAETKGSWGPKT